MTTGSSSGVAPPARPVPLPRATNGRPWRRGPHRGGDLRAGTRKAHRDGAADRDAGVSRVQRELERFGTRTILADGGSEVGDELLVRRVGVRDTRDATD